MISNQVTPKNSNKDTFWSLTLLFLTISIHGQKLLVPDRVFDGDVGVFREMELMVEYGM